MTQDASSPLPPHNNFKKQPFPTPLHVFVGCINAGLLFDLQWSYEGRISFICTVPVNQTGSLVFEKTRDGNLTPLPSEWVPRGFGINNGHSWEGHKRIRLPPQVHPGGIPWSRFWGRQAEAASLPLSQEVGPTPLSIAAHFLGNTLCDLGGGGGSIWFGDSK